MGSASPEIHSLGTRADTSLKELVEGLHFYRTGEKPIIVVHNTISYNTLDTGEVGEGILQDDANGLRLLTVIDPPQLRIFGRLERISTNNEGILYQLLNKREPFEEELKKFYRGFYEIATLDGWLTKQMVGGKVEPLEEHKSPQIMRETRI